MHWHCSLFRCGWPVAPGKVLQLAVSKGAWQEWHTRTCLYFRLRGRFHSGSVVIESGQVITISITSGFAAILCGGLCSAFILGTMPSRSAPLRFASPLHSAPLRSTDMSFTQLSQFSPNSCSYFIQYSLGSPKNPVIWRFFWFTAARRCGWNI